MTKPKKAPEQGPTEEELWQRRWSDETLIADPDVDPELDRETQADLAKRTGDYLRRAGYGPLGESLGLQEKAPNKRGE